MDTIAVISTALQQSAISLIRVSGSEAISMVNGIFSRDLLSQESHTVQYGYIVDENGEKIDEVLVTVFRAPKSYTKEDIVEISCHGGPFITRRVLALVLSQGARLALPGEFTQRAFLNGRIDLAQAESVQDLLEATNGDQSSIAMNGLRGSVKTLVDPFLEGLVQIISNIEVNIDYPEYDDVNVLTEETLLPMTKQWIAEMDEILRQAQTGKVIREGIKTAIVGKPNVGKSSLLNALLEEEKAIVTPVAGTTRDIVEGEVHLPGLTLHLLDTAGIHATEDLVEQIGIDRSYKAVQDSELVLVVLDGSAELDEEDRQLLEMTEGKNRLVVYNKTDQGCIHEGIRICAKDQDIRQLLDALQEKYADYQKQIHKPMLTNERQIGLMMQARKAMVRAKEALENHIELDLVTIDLQQCHRCMMEIIGGYSKEELLDEIFSRFCLGK